MTLTHQTREFTDRINALLAREEASRSPLLVTPRVRFVLDGVCAFFGVTEEMLTGSRGNRTLAMARHAAAFLLMKDLHMSSTESGRVLRRHHTTVLVAVARVVAALQGKGPQHETITEAVTAIRKAQHGPRICTTERPYCVRYRLPTSRCG